MELWSNRKGKHHFATREIGTFSSHKMVMFSEDFEFLFEYFQIVESKKIQVRNVCFVNTQI